MFASLKQRNILLYCVSLLSITAMGLFYTISLYNMNDISMTNLFPETQTRITIGSENVIKEKINNTSNKTTIHKNKRIEHVLPATNKTEYRYSMMTIEERVRYYLTPKWYSFFTKSKDIYINISLFNFDIEKSTEKLDDYRNPEQLLISQKILESHLPCKPYCTDTLHLLRSPEMKKCKYHNPSNRYIMQYADKSVNTSTYPSSIPVLTKARFMNKENDILLKLYVKRHFGFYSEIAKNDVPWEAKDNRVLWRGSMSGYHGKVRYTLVNKYFKFYEKRNDTNITIDIAFDRKNLNYKKWIAIGLKNTSTFVRKLITIPRLLQSKYLISISGNDVATNLGWILYSNSVPFLFRLPLEESGYEAEAWLMHGLLLPYVHYIPFTVNNDTDESLMNAFEFCESHSENCSKIAQNGKQWMMQFRNSIREHEIQMRILQLYCHSVHVI